MIFVNKQTDYYLKIKANKAEKVKLFKSLY